jgi:hypothetical protein
MPYTMWSARQLQIMATVHEVGVYDAFSPDRNRRAPQMQSALKLADQGYLTRRAPDGSIDNHRYYVTPKGREEYLAWQLEQAMRKTLSEAATPQDSEGHPRRWPAEIVSRRMSRPAA